MTDAPQSKRYFGRWFRFYASAVDDPKIQTLPDPLFRTWINLLCLASKADGVIPSGKQLSFGLRLSDALTKKRLDNSSRSAWLIEPSWALHRTIGMNANSRATLRLPVCVRFGTAKTIE